MAEATPEFATLAHYMRALDYVNDGDYDIVHDHSGQFLLYKRYFEGPLLTTLHCHDKDFWDREVYRALFGNSLFSAVSQYQAHRYDYLPVIDVVYNGIDVETFPFSDRKEDYLLFLGKMSEQKGAHIAIEVAQALGERLVIAGYIGDERMHFEERIKPHIDGDRIRFVGPVNDEQKKRLYRDAKAVLMPSQYTESFGLVLAESMACGTPVIAFNRGAVGEVVADGETGYAVESIDDMKYAGKHIREIDPRKCRERVEQHFSSETMAQRYLDVYKRVIETENA